MTPQGNADGRLFTVVIALTDHRGWAHQAVRAWNAQTCSRERFSLMLLHDGGLEELASELAALMQPHDEIIREPGLSEIALYDLGVRRAATDWIFLSEPHVEPLPDAAVEMMSHLERRGLDGAACNSGGCAENNYVGQLEDVVFARDFQVKGDELHWNKILLRGCCFKRQAYLECGGLDDRHGHFSEPLLGARLRDRGYRFGTASRSICLHHGTSRFRTLMRDQFDYGYREMRCCMALDPEFESCYFGLATSARQPACVRFRFVGRLCVECLRERKTPAAARDAARLLLHSRPVRRLGYWCRRGLNLVFAAGLQAGRWMPATMARLAPAFWDSCIQTGREAYLLGAAARGPGSPDIQRLCAAQLGPANSIGFHDLERHDEAGFRWSRGAALVLLPLPPGNVRVTLELLPLRVYGADERVVLVSNTERATYNPASGARVAVSMIGGREAVPLYILSTTRVPEAGSGDKRALGVACAAVSWEGARPEVGA